MQKSPPYPPNPLRRIELLAYPQVQALDAAGPLQVFATANDLAGGNGAAYAIHVVARPGGALPSSFGLGLLADDMPPPGSAGPNTPVVAGGPGVAAASRFGRRPERSPDGTRDTGTG